METLRGLSPARIKTYTPAQLDGLAETIRDFLIASVAKTGGHIGANLGTIELAIALHYVYDSPRDKILWDTGHQGYAHRILTGRVGQFATLNKWQGMSRFLQRSDSPHDILDATHAGTALSTAIGVAQGMHHTGNAHRVIVVVGDGALGEGSTWEGLNYLGGTQLPILVVINDNGMSIPPTVGGITRLLGTGKHTCAAFEALGFHYTRCELGHSIEALTQYFTLLKPWLQPTVLHVKTEKGRGLACAATHPYRMHFSMPFDPQTGAGASPTVAGRTYATVAAEALATCMEQDRRIVVLTPGTPYASGLEALMQQWPDRVIDVGMAEQHAVSMAAGLALSGCKPVVCFQSTFLQRAYDQILHDVCYMDLPVTFLVARSGFAGYDGPTHHGLWDIPVLRSFPHMQIVYPAHPDKLTTMLQERLHDPHVPMTFLYAYDPIMEPQPPVLNEQPGYTIYREGTDGTLVCIAPMLQTALTVAANIHAESQAQLGVWCVSAIKPAPWFGSLPLDNPIITLEPGMMDSGFGSIIMEMLGSAGQEILRCGTPNIFVPAGNHDECALFAGLSAHDLTTRILKRWPHLGRKDTG